MMTIRHARSIQHAGRQQRGVALVVGLIILLVMTMIGIIAIRNSTQQGRMAGSYQQQSQAFQGSESAIRLVMAQVNQLPGSNLTNAQRNLDMPSAVIQANTTYKAGDVGTTPPDDLPAGAMQPGVINIESSRASSGGAGFNASANFYSTGICGDGSSPCPMMVGSSINKYSAFSFEANAVAKQPRASARTNNIQGITMIAPRQGN